jgi:hypothetical protein
MLYPFAYCTHSSHYPAVTPPGTLDALLAVFSQAFVVEDQPPAHQKRS